MKFTLKSPCANCPFRTDCPPGWLGRSRAVEIAGTLFGRFTATFPCHKTIDYDAVEEEWDEAEAEDREPEGITGYHEQTQHCAGALILMEREETQSQMAQVAQRLSRYDPAQLNLQAPVFQSVEEFVNHHSYDD